MNPHYSYVARRAGHRCEYCRAPEAIFNIRFEVEHIRPQAEAGTNEEQNLALACRSCNLYKSAHLTGFDEMPGGELRLFHPRRDNWVEHFEAVVGEGSIRGLTDVGRATVARLRMNGESQVNARLRW